MDTQPSDRDADTALQDREEAGWLQQARAGNRLGFRALVKAHQPRVFSIALRLTGQRADAEELAQDAFMQLHASLGQITSPLHLKHWLIRVVSHRAIDRLRHQGRKAHALSLNHLPERSLHASPDEGGDPMAAARLQTLLLELEPEMRVIVLMHYQQDLSAADIARVLEMPVNTVKSHLRRSIEWLRAQCTGGHHGS